MWATALIICFSFKFCFLKATHWSPFCCWATKLKAGGTWLLCCWFCSWRLNIALNLDMSAGFCCTAPRRAWKTKGHFFWMKGTEGWWFWFFLHLEISRILKCSILCLLCLRLNVALSSSVKDTDSQDHEQCVFCMKENYMPELKWLPMTFQIWFLKIPITDLDIPTMVKMPTISVEVFALSAA